MSSIRLYYASEALKNALSPLKRKRAHESRYKDQAIASPFLKGAFKALYGYVVRCWKD